MNSLLDKTQGLLYTPALILLFDELQNDITLLANT